MSIKIPRVNSKFQPILLQGHIRSITNVKYNADGDLLFTCSKDQNPTVWEADNGERIGTYGHHGGTVWDIDADFESKYVLTACGDGNARLFEATTGKYIARMPHKGPVRAVKWGDGGKLFATASDPFTTRDRGFISIFEFPTEEKLFEAPPNTRVREDPAKLHAPLKEIEVGGGSDAEVGGSDTATCIGWTIADQYIIAGFESGYIVKYDVATGREIKRTKAHEKRVNRINFNRDKSMFITASKDCTAKLMDPFTLEVIKTFVTDRPVNGAVISPTHPHILLGGGQDAQSVTTTDGSQGKFETRFFHSIYGEEFARVRGHFGPINALDVHPFGKSFASGSEDGFIRLHHFDSNYLNMPDYIPSELK